MKTEADVKALRLRVEDKLAGGLEPNRRRFLQGVYAALCWCEDAPGGPHLPGLQVEGLAGEDAGE